jgi:hypothetical protein
MPTIHTTTCGVKEPHWLSFRKLGAPFAPLPGVTAGEHHFVVCIVEDSRLFDLG